MKDGIIKGTGNSRYLKSSIDANTTFAEFLAALRAGTLPIDLNGINADGWTQIGSALNKANLLDDDTAFALNLGNYPTVNEALFKLSFGEYDYAYRVSVRAPNGTPIPGVVVGGITTINGGACSTNDSGIAFGLSNNETVTLSVTSAWDDIESGSILVTSTGKLTEATLTLRFKEYFSFATSGTFKISPLASSMDVCCVGGGGGGGYGGYYNLFSPVYYAGGGGGGGNVTNAIGVIPIPDTAYTVIVGAGGIGGVWKAETNNSEFINATAGGSSYVSVNGNNLAIAAGGNGGAGSDGAGGTGNGAGGAADNPGNAGTVYEFNDNTRTMFGGGGGGGTKSSSQKDGGAPYGGKGCVNKSIAAEHGKGAGGGGGGGFGAGTSAYNYGGDGYRGQVSVRVRHVA